MEIESNAGYKFLLEFENKWQSYMGGSIPGERVVFRGKDVFSEFDSWNWLSMLYFCVTGKKPSRDAEKFLNGFYCMCYNYADPRIWNNQVATLAGTVSSTAQLAVCSASAVSEAVIYGGPPVSQALEFLYAAKHKFDAGISIKEIIDEEVEEHGVVYGFGRPVNKHDERIKPALALLKNLGFYDRTYVQFALKIQNELLQSKSKIGFNIGGVMAAFCADENMTAKQLYQLMVVCFYIGQLACYIESDSKPVGSFFPLRCNRISYEGVDIRSW